MDNPKGEERTATVLYTWHGVPGPGILPLLCSNHLKLLPQLLSTISRLMGHPLSSDSEYGYLHHSFNICCIPHTSYSYLQFSWTFMVDVSFSYWPIANITYLVTYNDIYLLSYTFCVSRVQAWSSWAHVQDLTGLQLRCRSGCILISGSFQLLTRPCTCSAEALHPWRPPLPQRVHSNDFASSRPGERDFPFRKDPVPLSRAFIWVSLAHLG